jgi:hypothetical protein
MVGECPLESRQREHRGVCRGIEDTVVLEAVVQGIQDSVQAHGIGFDVGDDPMAATIPGIAG